MASPEEMSYRVLAHCLQFIQNKFALGNPILDKFSFEVEKDHTEIVVYAELSHVGVRAFLVCLPAFCLLADEIRDKLSDFGVSLF